MVQGMIERSEQAVRDLRAQMPGRVTAQRDEGYNEARKVWNRAADHSPALIAFCGSEEDVQVAIRTARTYGMPVSVRSRGHDVCGRSVRSDAIVIDLSLMNRIRVEGSIATIGGGATAGNVIAAAAERDLMAVTGWHGVPGMTGLVTVGGYGPLIASHGLALDNLIGAELVLADGQRVTVGQGEEPELHWALKGGGGNFGVITSMKVRLHRNRRVLSGMILFHLAEAQAVLARYAKVMASASINLSVAIGFISLPDGTPALFLAPAWTGEQSDGEIAMEVLKRCGSPLHVQIASMSYQDLVQSFDSRVLNERHYALETRWVRSLDTETISALVAGGANRTSPSSTIILQHFRGLPTQLPPSSTAFGLRREHVMIEVIACWDPTTGDNGVLHRRWARDLSRTLAPMSLPGGYPNFLGPHAEDQIAQAYGDNITRLRTMKTHFDPDGLFSATPLPA